MKGQYTSKCLSKTVAEVTLEMDTLTTAESDHSDDIFDPDHVFLEPPGMSSYDNNSKFIGFLKVDTGDHNG